MLLDTLGQLDPLLVGAALLALLTLDGSLLIGAVLPGDAAIIVAGTALTGPAEIAVAAAAGVIGCFLGATGGWLIGRRYGPRVRHSRAGRWIGEHRWARAERITTGEGGGPALAAAYFLPMVNALTPVLAGSLGMPYGRFIRWAVAGGAAWVTTYLVLGSLAGEFMRDNQHLMVPITGCAAVLAAGLIVIARRTRAGRAAATATATATAEIGGPDGAATPAKAGHPGETG
ncbi:VTT domain-containing protein [Streptosporangium sp. NPDC051022]|uniref:DedA family protein n=1 Tax=Streptosporangium sp. NPDC051022 TaxID=3155752 RepID=UPI003424C239